MVKLIKIEISHLTAVAARSLMLYDGSKYPKLRFISNVRLTVRLIISGCFRSMFTEKWDENSH